MTDLGAADRRADPLAVLAADEAELVLIACELSVERLLRLREVSTRWKEILDGTPALWYANTGGHRPQGVVFASLFLSRAIF
jgi:hypothetical protein